MDENARRLQDVVDKGPWLIYQDDQLAGVKQAKIKKKK